MNSIGLKVSHQQNSQCNPFANIKMLMEAQTHTHKQRTTCRFLCFWEMDLIANYPLTNAMYNDFGRMRFTQDPRRAICSANSLHRADFFYD